jgi:NADH oxidase (H2O2-forming)
MNVVIIGGGSAGSTAAFELRKLDKDIGITIVEQSPYTEYSPCALPYVISGEIKSFKDIFVFSEKDYESNNIKLLLKTRVGTINRKAKKLSLDSPSGKSEMAYDKLVIATGSEAFVPKLPGAEAVYTLRSMGDAERIKKSVKKGSKTLIVGAGFIGVELADALLARGEHVTLAECGDAALPMMDPDMAGIISEHLEKKGATILLGSGLEGIKGNKAVLGGKKMAFDKIISTCGVRARLSLASDAGLKLDKGIAVDKFQRTSDPDIYACGDCAESEEFGSGEKILSQLGTTAVRHAKAAACHILGKANPVSPSLGNSVSYIRGLYFGSVGMSSKRAQDCGIKTVSARYSGNLRAEYFPSDETISVKLICDAKGILIGAQLAGSAEIAGRLDMLSFAIESGAHISDIADMQFCYNPATAPIFDPVGICAGVCMKKLARV